MKAKAKSSIKKMYVLSKELAAYYRNNNNNIYKH